MEGYDAAWFTLALALGRTPDDAAAGTMSALIETARAETAGDLPALPLRPHLRLLPAARDEDAPAAQRLVS